MASQSEQDPGHFHRGFERWAGRVRRRLLLRRVLTGLALGLALGAAIALAFWWQRLGHLRPWAAVAGVVGMGVAALIDHVATVSQGQGLMALLTFPAELVRGVFTHVLPLAVGTGTVTGVVGYAIGKEAFKGAPLKDDSTPKERSPSLDP